MRMILASRSERRAALLAQLGIDFEIMAADIDESLQAGEAPDAYVIRMAKGKAATVAGRAEAGRIVLGADTTVVCDGATLAKPSDRDDARRMLRRLSGRTHRVYSGVAVIGTTVDTALSVTEVTFGELDPAEIEAYVATEEPWDKAGAYAIQGRAARFVARIEGSYSGVVGLPLYETCRLLDRVTGERTGLR